MDWSWLVDFNVPPRELILRGTALYWLLFLVFRFLLRRDVGAVGVADVLFVVLIADASQNAMAGGYTSVAEGAVLIGTLVAWNILLDRMAFHFRWAERFLEPPPLLLVRRGRIVHRHLRAEAITTAELLAHLHKHGLESLDKVKAAWLESDGEFSVVQYGDKQDVSPKKRRRPGA